MHYSHVLVLGLWTSLGSSLKLTVSSTGGNQTSPLQYGIMFEDINRSGDGGIYAELINNRAFQGNAVFPSTINPWTPIGDCKLSLQTASPVTHALPTHLNVYANSAKGDEVGIRNPGYWGIDVKPQKYEGSFFTRGSYNGTFTARLESALTNQVWASTNFQVKSLGHGWTKHYFEIVSTASAPYPNNTFSLTWQDGTSLDINMITLFPPTYKNRPNGMRIDIMNALKELNPSFLRMPGGNNIEGNSAPYYWKWNETIGPLQNRPGRPGTWGYQNTDGLGLIEYLEWCDDLGMEPVLAVWSGLYLDGTVMSQAALQPYIQDTMDELEFIMGDKSTPYGGLRASLGYPNPWKINYVEIGNEDNLNNGGSSYNSYRFMSYYNAIIAKYPNMKVIASTVALTNRPGTSEGDYHQYTRPDYFVSQYNFFDQFPTAHDTLIGEYAHVQPNSRTLVGTDWGAPKLPYPVWIGTVSEAIFLIGAERNTDHIIGASFAPLLQNMNSYVWSPDLISFTADPGQTVRSTSHYQIKLFSNTRMTTVLPVTADSGPGPAYWVAGSNSNTKQYIMKSAVYNATAPVPFTVSFPNQTGKTATLTVLTAPDPYSSNVLNGKNQVISTVTNINANGGSYTFNLPNWSVALLTSPM